MKERNPLDAFEKIQPQQQRDIRGVKDRFRREVLRQLIRRIGHDSLHPLRRRVEIIGNEIGVEPVIAADIA